MPKDKDKLVTSNDCVHKGKDVIRDGGGIGALILIVRCARDHMAEIRTIHRTTSQQQRA